MEERIFSGDGWFEGEADFEERYGEQLYQLTEALVESYGKAVEGYSKEKKNHLGDYERLLEDDQLTRHKQLIEEERKELANQLGEMAYRLVKKGLKNDEKRREDYGSLLGALLESTDEEYWP